MKNDDHLRRQEREKKDAKALDQRAKADKLLANVKSFSGRVPLDFKFDREEANMR